MEYLEPQICIYIAPEEAILTTDSEGLMPGESDMEAKQAGEVEEDFKSHFSGFGKSLWGDEDED